MTTTAASVATTTAASVATTAAADPGAADRAAEGQVAAAQLEAVAAGAGAGAVVCYSASDGCAARGALRLYRSRSPGNTPPSALSNAG